MQFDKGLKLGLHALHRERVENARGLEWSNLTYFFLGEIN